MKSLLIDQLLVNPHIEEEMKKKLKSATVIEIGDVANYCCREAGRPWDRKKDFPNAAPPFDHFFLEWRTPSLFLGGEYNLDKWGLQTGLLCRCDESVRNLFDDNPFDGAKWILHITVFQKLAMPQLQGYLGPYWSWLIGITENGDFLFDENENTRLKFRAEGLNEIALGHNATNNLTLQRLSEHYNWMSIIGFLAISFMHCKNVVLRKETPPTVQQTVKQKRQRIQPHQPVTYHVLDIEPMKQVLKTEGKSDQVGLQRALHICRGHFSTYTEDHRLFGKYAGTFWIPQHVRGSAEVGFATKDYRIKLDK